MYLINVEIERAMCDVCRKALIDMETERAVFVGRR